MMASGHGAGLMLAPALFPVCFSGSEVSSLTIAGTLTTSLAAVGIHTVVMVCVGGSIAMPVYDWIGVEFLRRE